jgi:hypothetical protein
MSSQSTHRLSKRVGHRKKEFSELEGARSFSVNIRSGWSDQGSRSNYRLPDEFRFPVASIPVESQKFGFTWEYVIGKEEFTTRRWLFFYQMLPDDGLKNSKEDLYTQVQYWNLMAHMSNPHNYFFKALPGV